MKKKRWITEEYQGVVATGFRLKKKLFSGRSAFQKVEVFDTTGHGRMLFNDGMAMISERDEFVYHEMIVHVPLFTHPRPRTVLVIGGGDGGTVREVLRHKSVERCVLVEIDAMVVDACTRFIPQTAGALRSRRVEVLIEDGARFVETTEERFDVVIVDSTEPFGPATPLFGPKFYAGVRRILTRQGIVVSQGGSPFYEPANVKSLIGLLKPHFKKPCPYLFTNLTYPGGLWAFTIATKGLNPLKISAARIRASKLKFSYYNENVHRAAFALPEFLKKNL